MEVVFAINQLLMEKNVHVQQLAKRKKKNVTVIVQMVNVNVINQ
jgi:hypothetical protein